MSRELIGPLAAAIGLTTLAIVVKRAFAHREQQHGNAPASSKSAWEAFNERVEREELKKASAEGSKKQENGEKRNGSNEEKGRPEIPGLVIEPSSSPLDNGEVSPARLPIRPRDSLELLDPEELAFKAQTSLPQPQVIKLHRGESEEENRRLGLKAHNSLENLHDALKNHHHEPQPEVIQLQRRDSKLGIKASDSLEYLHTIVEEKKQHPTEPQPKEIQLQRTDSKLSIKTSDSLEYLHQVLDQKKQEGKHEPQPAVIYLHSGGDGEDTLRLTRRRSSDGGTKIANSEQRRPSSTQTKADVVEKSLPQAPSWLRGRAGEESLSSADNVPGSKGSSEKVMAEFAKGSGSLQQRQWSASSSSSLSDVETKVESPQFLFGETTARARTSDARAEKRPSPAREVSSEKRVKSDASSLEHRRGSPTPALKLYDRINREGRQDTRQALEPRSSSSPPAKEKKREVVNRLVMGSPTPSMTSTTVSGVERSRVGTGLKRISRLVQSGLISTKERSSLKSLLLDENEHLLRLLEEQGSSEDDEYLVATLRQEFIALHM